MNLRSPKAPNLQSGAIDRSAIPPTGNADNKRDFAFPVKYAIDGAMKKDRPWRGDKRPDSRRTDGGRTDRKPGKDGDRRPRSRDRDHDREGRKGGDRPWAKPSRGAEGKPKARPFDRPQTARPARENREPGRQDRPREKKPPRLHATLWGTHAVTEAWLNPARRIRAMHVTEPMLKEFQPVLAKARESGLKRPEPQILDKKDMDRRLPPGAVHQGIALDAEPLEECFVQDIVAATDHADRAVVLILDQVTDPHNVGAILRSASAFGAAGVIMQRRHSPEMTGVLAKAACGAVEHLPVCYETNLSRALETLQEAGFFAIGLDERGTDTLADLPKKDKCVLLLGAEGAGLRQKLREQCNALARLPTQGPIQSLNVSNAAAVALYAVSN